MDSANTQHEGEFSFTDMVSRAVHYWWLAAGLMIVGGLIGLLASTVRKPVYESVSVITTVIDFAYSGRLTDYEEDHLLTAIGDVIQSSQVMEDVIEMGIQNGLASSAEEMRSIFTASRQGYRWELSARSNDPEVALEANRLWLNSAVSALEQFRLDSIKALAEFNTQAGIENCFQQAVVVEPVSAYCSATDFQALRDQINSFESGTSSNSLLSRLLASRVSFQVTTEPGMPGTPAHMGRNSLTIAGFLLGLLAAVLLLVIGFPRRVSRIN
jgi:hypothetical protein